MIQKKILPIPSQILLLVIWAIMDISFEVEESWLQNKEDESYHGQGTKQASSCSSHPQYSMFTHHLWLKKDIILQL